jgi:hypothetical protein
MVAPSEKLARSLAVLQALQERGRGRDPLGRSGTGQTANG